MLLCLFLCYTLFIPIISGISTEATKDLGVTKMLMKNITSLDMEIKNISNIPIITEGGSTVQISPINSLKQNRTDLSNLDTELEKDKSVEDSPSSKVKPRKGVVYHVENKTLIDDTTKLKEVPVTHAVTKSTKGETQALSPPHKNSTTPSVAPHSSKAVSNDQPKPSTKKELSTTPMPKKPRILSNVQLDKEVIQKTDFKTLATSLGDKSVEHIAGPGRKIEPMNSSRHPGMVMPVVITMLVLPMFAVLGYMALRRGQEAWKNRHYKRMDFLLDGMYNE